MKIFQASVLTVLALAMGAQAWAQSPSTAPAPAALSKRERIQLCKQKRTVPLDPAAIEALRLSGNEGEVTRPKILHQVPPRPMGSSGKVIVESIIDEDGCVRGSRILQGASKALDAAALEAIADWVFLPATRDGHPVKVYYVLTVNNH
jgi:TonB family protein